MDEYEFSIEPLKDFSVRNPPIQRKVSWKFDNTFASIIYKRKIYGYKAYFEKVMQDFNQFREGRSLRKYCSDEGIDYNWVIK